MMSFFSKKKTSPDTTPEEVIQGPANPTTTNNGPDDFIFVERRPNDVPEQHRGAMYPPVPPPMGNSVGLPYPHPLGYPSYPNRQDQSADSLSSMSYLQGVPFELSPQLNTKGDFDVIQTQVDGVLAFLTRQMSVDADIDYDFSLERSVQSDCY